MPRITPNLWFDPEGEQAPRFYVAVAPNPRIPAVTRYGDAGTQPAVALAAIGDATEASHSVSVDISEVVQTKAAAPAAHLVVESWTSAGGLRTRDRR